MSTRPINYIFLEGPDLAGKTTFYENMHKHSGYRWNIQDRSALSMLVHAKYYGRDEFQCVEQLRSELFNLNNITIVLLPAWEEIAKRFNVRGDPIQNLTSLKKIYDLFSEAAHELETLPNVIVIRSVADERIVKYTINKLFCYEDGSSESLHENCIHACKNRKNQEVVGLNFTLYDDGTFEDIDEGHLLYDKEVDYYEEILEKTILKISNELAGNNEYERVESIESRRFIFNSETCISLAHFLVREDILDCKFFLRSSNVKDTLYYDINFIKHLTKKVYHILNLENFKCRIKITLNSAHILSEEQE